MSEHAGPGVDRTRLEALRYAVSEEAASYVAVMRVFTSRLARLLSDQSADEVREALLQQGIELDVDTVDARLSYLVEHGNLARSPRETEARSLAEYLRNRARYQLTARGELVHRHVEELLDRSEAAREVSSEMLGAIHDGLAELARLDADGRARVDPDRLARDIGTVFAQFDRLVHSTREFYAYLTQVLTRFDLGRDEFLAFKSALLEYLQRFVDEIQRHMPQLADVLRRLEPHIEELCARANSGARLVDLEGRAARRAQGLDPEDWRSLRQWFVGTGAGGGADALVVRDLATQAMNALLHNLRRIAGAGEREYGRYADLVRLAAWFDTADDGTAHALWAAAYGLYPARHLGFLADEPERRVPPTTSWWAAPAADVPVMLRQSGKRQVAGRTGATADFSAVKAARLAERREVERRRLAALGEVAALRGERPVIRLSDAGRDELLGLYGQALALLSTGEGSAGTDEVTVDVPSHAARLVVRRRPDSGTDVLAPSGRLRLVDVVLDVQDRTGTLARQEDAS